MNRESTLSLAQVVPGVQRLLFVMDEVLRFPTTLSSNKSAGAVRGKWHCPS